MFVEHSVFSLDVPENRVIKTTLLRLQRWSADNHNRTRIRRLLELLGSVQKSTQIRNDLALAKNSQARESQRYEQALIWAEIFLAGDSFLPSSGETSAAAVLFPMYQIFEDYIPDMLRDALDKELGSSGSYELRTQDTKYRLFDGEDGGLQLKPDIVVEAKGKTVVLDTKWKQLDSNEDRPGREDLYQMFAYGKRYQAEEVILIYPCSEKTPSACWGKRIFESKVEGKDQNGSESGSGGFKVKSFFVDLSKEGAECLECEGSEKDLAKALVEAGGK